DPTSEGQARSPICDQVVGLALPRGLYPPTSGTGDADADERLRKRASSQSSAQNSSQKNCPPGERQTCNSPFKISNRLRQNEQQPVRSMSPACIFIGPPKNHRPSANYHNGISRKSSCTNNRLSA